MSSLVMRPEAPVPGTCERSTLLSFAILRTSGEERRRSPAMLRQVRRMLRAAASRLRSVAEAGAAAGAAAGFPARTADDRDDGVDGDGRALLHLDLGERPGHGRRDLGVHLVGRDLEDRLVALDGVADLLEPLGDRAFGDGLAHLRHQDFGSRTARRHAAGGRRISLNCGW